MTAIPIGKGQIEMHGKTVAILAFGSMVTPAAEAGRYLGATVVNMRFVKPLDELLINEIVKSHDMIVTVEENAVNGGAGSAINEYLAQQSIQIPVINLGIPDYFVEQGSRDQCLEECGLNAAGIINRIEKHPQMNTCQPANNTLVF
jgi:1-deoxy-D-xylulose-5-phosphate synthase